MYGLLLESLWEVIKEKYGEEVIEQIRKQAHISNHTFVTHKVYSETLIPRIISATVQITGDKQDELMDVIGSSFVTYVGRYGYDQVLRVLGRNFRDFLNGLDNLHEYLKFSYPKLKPPSFFIENETSHGLTLHYRSKRRGFLHYVKGQLRTVGKIFYNLVVEVEVVSETRTEDMTHVVMQLHFDNPVYIEENKSSIGPQAIENLHSLDILFEVFPFHLLFNRALLIENNGKGLDAVIPGLKGKQIDEEFCLTRPLVEFSWQNILTHTNNVFEVVSMEEIDVGREQQSKEDEYDDYDLESCYTASHGTSHDNYRSHLKLKGQMMYMQRWDSMLYIATPVMTSLHAMFESGLYINDLSIHDSSRDLVLAGTQQSVELKMALDQEQRKSRKLEESMRKLDKEMKKTDELLYQMLPKPIAERLRKGEPCINTCETFDSVTILFSDVVGFTTICSSITPMQVVSMLNSMYIAFDQLSERHNVYKVETIGDAYMVVSGAPNRSKLHAHHICELAFDMLHAMRNLPDPSGKDKHISIRIGAHSGMVVAGVVGLKMPRYCLFGDTVNTASRMETTSEAMKIHLSQTTKELIETDPYEVELRESVKIKGKGDMETYWLTGKKKNSSNDFEALILDEQKRKIQNETDENQEYKTQLSYSPIIATNSTKQSNKEKFSDPACY